MPEIVLRKIEWPNSERSTLFINLNETYIDSNENFIGLKTRKGNINPRYIWHSDSTKTVEFESKANQLKWKTREFGRKIL